MRQPSDTRSPTAMDGGIEGLKRFPDPASGGGQGSPAGEDDAGRGVAEGKRRPLSAFRGVIDGAVKLRGIWFKILRAIASASSPGRSVWLPSGRPCRSST